MYAIIETGGKQHRVTKGEKLLIDLMGDCKKGDSITFDKVLFTKNDSGYHIGQPMVEGAAVTAQITSMGPDEAGVKGKKIIVFKKKRRKGYHKKQGHRQRYTEVQITEIKA